MGKLLAMVIGFSEGLLIGFALVAFLTMLDIIPRLAWLTHTGRHMGIYQWSLISGVSIAALCSLLNISISWLGLMVPLVGLFMGAFVGMVAAALAETLNVMPVVYRRLNLQQQYIYLGYSVILGKILGSLIQWCFPSYW